MRNLVVLKIGGSVITYKDRPFTENERALRRIAREIGSAYKKGAKRMILVHGAGSFGHFMVSKSGIHKGLKNPRQAMAFADTQRWQNYWNVVVTEYLQEEGVPAFPCQANTIAVKENDVLISLSVESVKRFLDIGLVPVLYGVPAFDTIQGSSILSGDEIVSWIARRLRPDIIIHGIDVDGIFTGDPKRVKGASLIERIDSRNWEIVRKGLGGSKSVDVTGGMARKVTEVMKSGCPAVFVNATVFGNVEKALTGQKVIGTFVVPRKGI